MFSHREAYLIAILLLSQFLPLSGTPVSEQLATQIISPYLSPAPAQETSQERSTGGRQLYLPIVFRAGGVASCPTTGRPNNGGTITVCPGKTKLLSDEIEFRQFFWSESAWKAKATVTWKVVDARGRGDGWRIDAGKVDCFDKNGHRINYRYFKARVQDEHIVTIAGNDPPVSAMKHPTSLTGSQRLMLYAQPGNGMGTYEFTPELELHMDWPGGKPYTCVLEVLLSPGFRP